jgi:Sec-independent protein translocase protein TatA
MFGFLNNIGSTEIILLVLILVVLFGGKSIAKRLAKVGGATVKEANEVKKEFLKAVEGDDDKPNKESSKEQ